MFSRITSAKHVPLKNFGGHGTVHFLGPKKRPRRISLLCDEQHPSTFKLKVRLIVHGHRETQTKYEMVRAAVPDA